MAFVALESLSKSFPVSRETAGTIALRELNLEVSEGELLVLVGPSGCGKSTTLRLIAGLEEPDQGQIRIDGRSVNALPPSEREVAMVFQTATLYPHLSVRNNLTMGLELRKLNSETIRGRLAQIAQMLEIDSLLERLPEQLSGGQQQRVAVGRALMRQPKVLLLDEPLSNLDAPARLQLRLELARWQRQLGTTMIYVTHDQGEAMALGQRVAVMKDGTLLQIDEPIGLYLQPANAFVASFIGSPPMNLLVGQVEAVGGAQHFINRAAGALEFRFPLAPGANLNGSATVVIGLRPEALSTQAGRNTVQLEARLDGVELHGPDTLWHLSRGPDRLIARLPGVQRRPIGATAQLHADVSGCHCFHPVTGSRLVKAAVPKETSFSSPNQSL